VALRAPNAQLEPNLGRYRMVGVGENHLTVEAIKGYVDGARGSRGACWSATKDLTTHPLLCIYIDARII
jgi:hypothetical protein